MKKIITIVSMVVVLLLTVSIFNPVFADPVSGNNSASGVLTDKGKSIITLQYSFSARENNSAVGLGLYGIPEEDNIGMYINLQKSWPHRSYSDIDYGNSCGLDPMVSRSKDIFIVNLGFTNNVKDVFMFYSGVGYGRTDGVVKRYDSSGYMGDERYYYMDDHRGDKSGINGNIGLLLPLWDLALEVGYNTFVNNAYVGVGIKF